jgi:hypothetical protein
MENLPRRHDIVREEVDLGNDECSIGVASPVQNKKTYPLWGIASLPNELSPI